MSNAHIHEWTVICPDCGLELVYAESVIVVLPKHQDIIKGKICGTAGRTIRTVLAPHAMASREAMTLS